MGESVWGQAGVVRSYIALGDDAKAAAAVEKLAGDYSGNEAVVDALDGVAKAYLDANLNGKAAAIYERIADSWPNSREAVRVLTTAAKLHVEAGDEAKAQGVIDKLVSRYPGKSSVPRAVEQIGESWNGVGRRDKAGEVYQYVIDQWPQSSRALWARMKLIITYVWRCDYDRADAETKKFIAENVGNERLGDAVHEIVESYFNVSEHERGKALYEYLLAQQNADKQTQMELAVGIVLSKMETEDEASTEAAIAELIANYKDGADLGKGLLQIGEKYYEQANVYRNAGERAKCREELGKATGVWQVIREDLEVCGATEDAWYYSGRAYEWRGEYAKAIQCYEKVVGTWPRGRHGDVAQYHIARSYHYWKLRGGIPTKEGAGKMRAAIKKLMEQYPDSPFVKLGINMLGGPRHFRGFEEGEDK